MKYICTLIPVYLFYISVSAQTGSSCATPHVLILDGVTRTYATSASTGNAVICTMPGSTPITYFSVTTNASAQMPLLNITGPGGTNCEVAMYDGACSGGNLEAASSICFYDATGLWTPAHNFTLLPNATYNLRIKTLTAGNISINARHYTAPNNTCSGATTLGLIPIWDHNACNLPDLTVNPSYLCAFSVENTAWYTYTLASTGTSTVNITSIGCDNGDANNSNGFQIGFFTGTSCASLIPLTCSSNSGATVSASTGTLPAGTRVAVGIDGVAGSNCQYQISASNSVGLAAYIKYFTAEKVSRSNHIKWASLQEFNNDYYEVERSANGKDFITVGRVEGALESYSEKLYRFEDDNPLPGKSFYRLKQVDIDGNIKYHRIVSVNRSDMPYVDLSFENPVSANLVLNIQTNQLGKLNLRVISMQGQVMFNETMKCMKGENYFSKNFSTLPPGKYIIEATNEKMRVTKTLVKTNGTTNIK
jgi:hypothetical protein